MKPFLNEEVAERIHFHTPDSDTLYKYIPRDILPKVSEFYLTGSLIMIINYDFSQELGGNYGTIDEWQNYMYQYLDSYR